VETYRSRLSYRAIGGEVAYTGGGPKATQLGSDGAGYVTRNGGVVRPRRGEDQRPARIQRIDPSGKVGIITTGGDGVRCQAANDLSFGFHETDLLLGLGMLAGSCGSPT
jgi:hypothetical protein